MTSEQREARSELFRDYVCGTVIAFMFFIVVLVMWDRMNQPRMMAPPPIFGPQD